MKRERVWPNISECKYCYFSFLYLLLKEKSFWTSILEFPLAFPISFLFDFPIVVLQHLSSSLSLSLFTFSLCFSHCLTLSLCLNLSASHSCFPYLLFFVDTFLFFSIYLNILKQNKKYVNTGIPEVWTH